MVDTTTPTAPVLTGGSTYWSNTTLTISVQTDSISPSGIKNYQYYISINSTTPTGGSWTDCSTSKTSQTITTEGIRYIFFRAVNNVGTTGNLSAYQTTMIDTKNTTLDGYEIKNVTKTGYDIYFYGLRTPNGISKIQIPTWTIYNGQDDLPTGWKNNNLFTATYIDNNTYSYHVNIENHNNEAGKYRSHVYILDKNNKWFNPKQIDYILETTNYVGSLYLDNSKSVFNKDGYYRIKETTLYSNFTYDFNAQPNAITAISQLGSYHLDTSNNNTLLHDLMSTETNTAGIGLNIGINGAVAIAHTGNYYYTLLSYEGDLTASHWYRFTVKNNIPSLYIDGKLAATGIQPVNGSQLDNRFNPPAYTVTKLVSLTAIGGGSYGKYSGTANNFVVYNTAK